MAGPLLPARPGRARRRNGHTCWLSVLAALLALAPLLGACSTTPVQPAASASATYDFTPLPQVVEAYMADLPGPSPKLFLTTRVYDRSGTLLGEFWDEGHRYWVTLDRVAPAVRQATVATEDKTFYTNPGVDWAAIARAVMQNSDEGDVVSGASTMTQQLARNITMPYDKRIEQTLERKVSESVLAQDLTARFSKDQIFEMYLNVVYYGHLAYGIEAAARTFFAKSAADLTLAESALLAALPQSPAALDPLVPASRNSAKARQGLVLALMARNGYITMDQARAAYAEPLNYRSEQITSPAPQFLQYVHDYLAGRYGADLVNRGGLTVNTSLDLCLQQRVEGIVRTQVAAVRSRYNLTNAAVVALRPQTGEVLALVGSADFNDPKIDGQVNVAVSPRQPGSAIKPILYSLAFSRGLSPADMIDDAPVSFRTSNGQIYAPTNYDGRYHGTVRLRTALANSYNVPAVKLLSQMGVPSMIAMAHAMGIRTLNGPPGSYGLAITLGGSEVTLLDLTSVYGTLANAGVPAPATPITVLTDNTGHRVESFAEPRQPVIDPRVAYMVTSILSDNQARLPMFGPNSPLKLSRPAAAKTGTTTDWRDNWTIGYTPYVVVGVWAGNSNGQPMRNTTGLTGAAPIWHDVMEAIFADPALDHLVRPARESLEFARPAGLLDVPLCGSVSCPPDRTDLFIDGTRPITISLTLPTAVSVGSAGPPAPTPTPTGGFIVRSLDPAVVPARVNATGPRRFCMVDQGGQPLAVVLLPADPAERQRVSQWADRVGVPVATGPCNGQKATALPTAPPVMDPVPLTSSAIILDPAPGSTVTGMIAIRGSALFDRQEVQFYKVEYGAGSNPSTWVTMGSGHPDPVADDWLETWHADALPNGPYSLRLVLVKRDGNYMTTTPVSVEVRH